MSQSVHGIKLLTALLMTAAALVLVLGLLSSTGSGKTIIVDDDGPADYDTIQDAVNAADEGDTIRVRAGSYDPFWIDKTLTVIGAGWETTEVRDEVLWEGIDIDADNVNVSGFLVSPGSIIFYSDGNTVFNNNLSRGGIGIREDRHNNIIRNNIFHDCSEAILAEEDSHNNTITQNRFLLNDDSISCTGARDYVISQNTFTDGTATAIYLDECNGIKIQRNVIENNRHGIVTSESPDTNISSNIIRGSQRYGIRMYGGSVTTVERNQISENRWGIGMYETGGCWIHNNSILDNVWGIHVDYGDSPDYAQRNNIVGNSHFGVYIGPNYESTFNASYNWWGDDTGPYNDTENPDGEGDEITTDVDFITWLEDPLLIPVIIGITQNVSSDDMFVEFHGFGIGEEINKYAWGSSIDDEFFNGTYTKFKNDQLSVGTHTITFNVRQRSGNVWSEKITTTLIIHEQPFPTIEDISPSDGLDTDDIYFEGSGTDDGTVVQYAWRSTIDGEFYNDTETSFTHDGLSNGSHLIYLKIMDNDGSWSDEVPGNLKIQGRPVAHIDDMDPNPALEGEEVTIRGRGTDDGTIERMIWESSIDGTLSDGMEEELIIDTLSLGEHQITLEVQDDKDVWSYEMSSLLIITLQPEAFIDTIDPSPALDTDPILFDGSGTDGDGTIEQYSWRSDLDGELYTGTSDTFTSEALSNGTHSIFLKVMDNYGIWSEEISTTITVYGKPRARIASIHPNPSILTEEVFFRGTGSDEGTIEQYAWRSSIDGEFYNDTEESFYYDGLTLGIHTILLKVMDDDDIWSDEVARTQIVTIVPTAAIDEIDPNPAFDTDTLTYKGSGTDDGTIEQYAWRSSIDGEFYNDTDSEIDHRGLSNGTHTIFLSVMDNYGFWSEEVSSDITIHGKPQATIESISPRPASVGQNVTFIGSGSDDGTVVRYAWRSSIDGEFYNGTEDTAVFGNLSRAHHTIFFKVQDDTGFWSDEVEAGIIVSDIPKPFIDSISPNPALHVETVHFMGHGTDNGDIERYAWRSSIDGEFYNGTEMNITAFNMNEGFEGLNVTYDSGGYLPWSITNSISYEGTQCAKSGDVDDDEFSWMKTTYTWPGTLEFYWKVSSEDTDYLSFYVDGKVKDRISGDVGWTKYTITFSEGGHTVQWRYEKDSLVSQGEDAGYVDGIRYMSDLTLSNGTHTIFFRVLDNEDFWSPEISIPLVINGKPMITVMEINPDPAFHNDLITFTSEVLEDGNITSFVCWSDLDGELYNGNSSQFSITNLTNGTHTISLQVQDDSGTSSDISELSLLVRGKPFAFIENITPFFSLEGDLVHFTGNGTDDGSITQYKWTSSIDGELFNDSESEFATMSMSNGIHTIFLHVKDNHGHWSDQVNTTIIVNDIPQAVWDIVSPSTALDTEDIYYSFHGVDDDGITRYVVTSSIDGEIFNGTETEFYDWNLSLGSHFIYLKVQDSYGTWSNEVSRFIVVTLRPIAVIVSVTPNPAVHTDRIFFNGSYMDDGTVTQYSWRSSLDGIIFSGTSNVFNTTDLSNGTHEITLMVRDNRGFWSERANITLDINGIPYSHIHEIDPTFATDRDTITFTGDFLEDSSIIAFNWTSSLDGVISTDQSFSSSDLSNGTHTIFFSVQDEDMLWSEEVNQTITINGVPSVRISGIVPDPANEDEIVWLYGNVTDDGTIVEYSWASDLEGPIGNNLSFTTDMLRIGTHTITFMVRDNYGQWSDEVSDTVHINGLPSAVIEDISPGSEDPAVEGEDITFTGNGSDDGSITEYFWRSDYSEYLGGDRVFSLNNVPNGTHTIYLKVKDNLNVWSLEVSHIIRVNGIPSAWIEDIRPNPGVHTRPVTFHGGTSDDGTIHEHSWHSSIDGTLDNSKSFTRSDLSIGTHTITYKVRDNWDIWSTEVSTTLVIDPKPEPIISEIKPQASNSGDEIHFKGRGVVEGSVIMDYWWSSSRDGYLGNLSEFDHAGLSNGTHVIEFKVMDEKGIWSDGTTMTITVNGLPVAEIVSVSSYEITEDDTVNFTGAGSDDGSIQQYHWSSSASGVLYEGANPSFSTYQLANGTQTISLKVLDDSGAWSHEATTQIRVNGIPRGEISHISRNPAPEGHRIQFRADGNDDGNIVRYLWESSVDGIIYDGSDPDFRINTLTIGNHTIILTVQDDEGEWSFPDYAEIKIKEKEDEGLPWIMIAAGGAVGVILLLVIIFLVAGKKKKKDDDGTEKEQSPDQSGHQGQMPVPGAPPVGTDPAAPQAPDQQAGQVPPVPPVVPGGVQPSPSQQTQVPPGRGAPQPSPEGMQKGMPQASPMGTVPPAPIPASGGPAPQGGPAPGTPPTDPSAGAAPGGGTWFCPSCGNKLDEKFVFCIKCGFKR